MNTLLATRPRFEAWLLRETGIDAASLGINTVERAVLERVRVAQLNASPHDAGAPVDAASVDAYWERLIASPAEKQALIETLVVPETWFFRDREAYVALARLANERLVRDPSHVVRVLSAPCSTGEEPYSIAMTLLDAGIGENRFAVDALDISARAIDHARTAIYGRNAFRGHPLEFRDRHFSAEQNGWQLHERVRKAVRFVQANLFELPAVPETTYDFVFCRNVLIYFDRESQDRAIRLLDARLADGGTIFVGPAETGLMMRHSMSSARIPLAFAFGRSALEETAATPAVRDPAPKVAKAAPSLPVTPSRPAPFSARRPIDKRDRAAKQAATRPFAAPPAQGKPDAAASLDDARRHADAGRLDQAERLAHEHAVVHGPNVDAFYLLGLIADARGRTNDATDFYRKALYLDPAHYEALTHLAALLDIAGDRAGAQNLLQRAQRSAARAPQAPDEPHRSRGFHASGRS